MIFKLILYSYKERFQAVFLVLDSLERHARINMSFSGTPYEFAWTMKQFLGIPFKILYPIKSNPHTHVQFNIIYI